MKPIKLSFLLAILLIGCKDQQNQNNFERLDAWEELRMAAKEKRLDDLLALSKDTLECIECNDGENWIAKEAFFENYLNQIEMSDTKQYSFFEEEYAEEGGFSKRYRVNYEYKGKPNQHGHSKIYTLITGENGTQFQGVFSVP